jgi:tetratricopeptide (TPR) repeat protein
MISALLAACGCGALHPAWPEPETDSPKASDLGMWRRPPTTAEAGDKFAQARRLRNLGRTADAVSAVREAIDADPNFLEAHRLLQDLLSRTTADWWLRERYERRLREKQDDADSWYLLARIEPDPDRQIELFSQALKRDPRHPYATLGRAVALARRGDAQAAIVETRRTTEFAPWLALPWLWLGGESMKRGDPATALRFFESARDRARDDPRSWLGVAEAADDLGRRDVAGHAALEALQLAPGDDAVAAGATEILARSAPSAEVVDVALAALAAAEKDGAPVAPGYVLRGRLLLASGRPADAVSAFDSAVAWGVDEDEIAAPLRLARVLSGRFREAVEGAVETTPPEAFGADDAYAPRWARLRAAAAADLGGARALLELSEAMASLGWLQESRAVLTVASAMAPDDGVVAARVASESAFAAFVSDLGRIARDATNAAREGSSGPVVKDILYRISQSSLLRLGRDVARGAVIRSYPFLGEFTVSTASAGEFETTFGSHGLLCLVGARSGAPAELVVGRLVAVRAGMKENVAGEPVSFDECWIESEGLPPDAAGLHRGLAGLTLDRLVMLQLDAVRRGPRTASPGLPFVARPARTLDERRSLETPSDVAGRIESQLAASGLLEGAGIDAVRSHELVHVYDASRLVPMSAHPFQTLALGISHGFSGAAIERSLEGRAQTLSILSARSPRLALAGLLAFLPSKDGDTPHVAGYLEAVRIAVDILIADPKSFPSIDPAYNVVQQMDRLTDAEVRELARRVADKL